MHSPTQKRFLAERQHLRQQCRAQRNALTPSQQTQASMVLAKHLLRCKEFIRAKRIAVYFADDGEIDTLPLINRAWEMNKRTYAPVVRGERHLDFIQFQRNDKLARGKWGLLQPVHNKEAITPLALDLILIPLVAFDKKCNRLGRGGGYYDRFLSRLRRYRFAALPETRGNCRTGSKPFLLGLAHDCQCRSQIPVAAWDRQLDAVITDRQMIRNRR